MSRLGVKDRKRLVHELFGPHPVVEIGVGTGRSEIFKRGNLLVFNDIGVLVVVPVDLEIHSKTCGEVARCSDLVAQRDKIVDVLVLSWELNPQADEWDDPWVPKMTFMNHVNKLAPGKGGSIKLVAD